MTGDQKSAAEILGDLRARLAAKEHDLLTVQVERKKLSLDAAQGDRGAISRRATLLSQSKAALEAIEELRGAIDEAARRADDETAAEAERAKADARVLAQRLALKFLRQGERIDQSLLSVADAMAQRAELYQQLAATGVLAPAVLNRLSDDFGAKFFEAIHVAGLGEHLRGFKPWGASTDRPLSAADFDLLHDLLRDASLEPKAA